MSDLYVCREYEDRRRDVEGFIAIETLEEHDARVRLDAINKYKKAWDEIIEEFKYRAKFYGQLCDKYPTSDYGNMEFVYLRVIELINKRLSEINKEQE